MRDRMAIFFPSYISKRMSTTFFKCRGYELAVIILYKKHFHIYVTCIIQYIKALIDIFMDKYICGHINTPTFFITLINRLEVE